MPRKKTYDELREEMEKKLAYERAKQEYQKLRPKPRRKTAGAGEKGREQVATGSTGASPEVDHAEGESSGGDDGDDGDEPDPEPDREPEPTHWLWRKRGG